MRLCRAALLLLALPCAAIAAGQETPQYAFKKSFSVSAEYSNDSSHIFLGVSDNRRLAGFNLGYSRLLARSGWANWTYDLELHPVAFIQNPFGTFTYSDPGPYYTTTYPVQLCRPQTIYYSQSAVTENITCSSHWTYGAGASPLGQRINFAPRHRLQPYLAVNGGFLLSTRDIPGIYTARFNFTFKLGAGFEFFHDRQHAWTVEYHIQHLSNADHGTANPGIDSQVVQLGYVFGR